MLFTYIRQAFYIFSSCNINVSGPGVFAIKDINMKLEIYMCTHMKVCCILQ